MKVKTAGKTFDIYDRVADLYKDHYGTDLIAMDKNTVMTMEKIVDLQFLEDVSRLICRHCQL